MSPSLYWSSARQDPQAHRAHPRRGEVPHQCGDERLFQQHQDRLTVFALPCYSPDYNPIEKPWKKVKEKGTHLQYFPTFEALKNKVHETLSLFQNAPQEVLSLFGLYRRAIA
jgi:transposase